MSAMTRPSTPQLSSRNFAPALGLVPWVSEISGTPSPDATLPTPTGRQASPPPRKGNLYPCPSPPPPPPSSNSRPSTSRPSPPTAPSRATPACSTRRTWATTSSPPAPSATAWRRAAPPASRCCSSTTPPSRSASGTPSKEDARGLFVRGRLMPEVARAREVLALMRAGALDGLSIGFRAVKGRRDAAHRHAPPRESRPVGDLRRHLPAAARGARRPRQGAALRAPATHGTRIRALAHAGRWADALRRPGRSSAMASRASPRRTLLEATPRPAASSTRSTRRRGSCALSSRLVR